MDRIKYSLIVTTLVKIKMKGYNKDSMNIDKLLEQLKNKKISPKNYYKLLTELGYKEFNKGKTSGSARLYIHDTLDPLSLHKAHNRDFMHKYECIELIKILKRGGII